MEAFDRKTIAIIGAGDIGWILLKRLSEAGISASQVVSYESDPERVKRVEDEFGLRSATIDAEICSADMLLMAVPPKAVLDVLKEIGTALGAGCVVVSFAAGVPLEMLESLVPDHVAVVRVMPNAPSLVGEGMNPVVYGKGVDEARRALINELLGTLGQWIEVSDGQMNACVGLTGAAMRTLIPYLEGMIAAGIEVGFTDRESRGMAAQVARGTAALFLETELTTDEIKALTPMKTVDEEHCRGITLQAARSAQEKIKALERRLLAS